MASVATDSNCPQELPHLPQCTRWRSPPAGGCRPPPLAVAAGGGGEGGASIDRWRQPPGAAPGERYGRRRREDGSQHRQRENGQLSPPAWVDRCRRERRKVWQLLVAAGEGDGRWLVTPQGDVVGGGR